MADAGTSGSMPPPGFQKASEVLRANPAPSPTTNAQAGPSTLRNASGGLPPIPKSSTASEAAGDSASSTASNPSEAISGSNGETAAPKAVNKPINRPATSKNAIVYNAVQRRNPVLQSIKNVGIEIGDIAADYQVGTHNGVLFLSLKYHRLHPEYIHGRIEKIKNMYNVRILLVLCDVNEHQHSLRELSKIAIVNNLTLFVAWSNEEVAQYLTTFKAYEHKGDETLKEPIHQSYYDQFYHVLTSGKKVNKTDADNLASQFGSFSNISKQHSKVLSGVKGLGATKVTSLFDAFNKPFLIGGLKRDGGGGEVESTGTSTSIRTDGPGGEGDIGVMPALPAAEDAGSPDWPDVEDEDDHGRSPGVSPEPQRGNGGGVTVWRDPLDDDDEDGGDGGADVGVEPASKRIRVD